jgi:ATP-dependent RNA helicase DeaD
VAITIINYNEKKYITRIAAHYKIEFEERPLPRDEDIESLVSQRLTGQLETRLRKRDRLKIERMQRFVPLAKELAEDEDGIALLAMLLDDTYHEWMHHPPELPPVGGRAKSKPKRSGGRSRRGGSGKRRPGDRKGGGKKGN